MLPKTKEQKARQNAKNKQRLQDSKEAQRFLNQYRDDLSKEDMRDIRDMAASHNQTASEFIARNKDHIIRNMVNKKK